MNRSITRTFVAAALVVCAGAGSAQTVLKIGYSVPKESHYGAGASSFCDEIEKGTQARYKCQQFPSSSLGGEREMVEAVQLGTQDIVLTSTGPVGNFVPEIKVLDIPFLFRDYDHARKTLDGKIGQDLLTKFPSKGLVALAWTENGFRHMTNNKHPIQSVADANGLKLRTMENKVHMAGYKTFGILPTPMSMAELFTALQQGTVDGQENPIPVILSAKFAQVQKYLSLTGHVYSPALLLISPTVWGKVFLGAAKQSAVVQRKRVNDDEATGIAQLKKDGMNVVEKVDGDSFRKAIVPAYADFAKEFGADKIAAIQAVK
jgi:TRAP-type transport system periplasmic protein